MDLDDLAVAHDHYHSAGLASGKDVGEQRVERAGYVARRNAMVGFAYGLRFAAHQADCCPYDDEEVKKQLY